MAEIIQFCIVWGYGWIASVLLGG